MKDRILEVNENGIFKGSITFEGFLTLIEFFINDLQFEVPWIVLRRFNYDNELNLKVLNIYIYIYIYSIYIYNIYVNFF